MSFAERPPSRQWESFSLAGTGACPLWVWFHPPAAPGTVVIRVPQQSLQQFGAVLTVRALLASLNLQVADLPSWTIAGMTYPVQDGANPLLDQPLPITPGWGDVDITLGMTPQSPPISVMPTPFPAAGTAAPSMPVGQNTQALLSAMDSDWNAVLQLETQLGQMRKQLNSAQGRLQSLNRDLNPDERRAADSNDLKDWQDARRFLRDAATHVSRFIREHDVGITSGAGQRHRFEEYHQNHVATRQPTADLPQMQHELETYRKIVQSLVTKMQTALSNAGRDGEQRAQQILTRLAAKIRKSRRR